MLRTVGVEPPPFGEGQRQPVHTYQPGSWGPAEADQLVAAYGGWRDPWVGKS